MATLTVTIPTAVVQRVLDGFSYQNGYEDQIWDPANPNVKIPNPETKATFCKRILIERVKADVLAWEANAAARAAREAVKVDVDTNVVLN